MTLLDLFVPFKHNQITDSWLANLFLTLSFRITLLIPLFMKTKQKKAVASLRFIQMFSQKLRRNGTTRSGRSCAFFVAIFPAVLCRSQWSSVMIPEKVTWVQFPDRISTVYSKLLPINNLVFKFLIKHSYIFAFISFLTKYQIRKNVQICCISSATFLQFFSLFYALNWLLVVALALRQLKPIHKKVP